MGVAAFYRIPADPFGLHHEFALSGSVAGESELLRVVPAGTTLELDVYVPNRDIGFVHASQPAVVKLDAFPFTQYGTVPATITKIAAAVLPRKCPKRDRRRSCVTLSRVS
ncbi:HlyD family efflux transporter periplasmic adaptor subunit [Rhizobium leguminosarum]|uniref:HlyD family efflux transporter periplasmic adaptor subunit n=1 Tax=Rhizobium leguminosarum TaxID=384 RepID=UPI0021B0DDCC|nr:HlyD family efflux transporter periplasmic adaptor subunit [Rhizobium leguminosarum]